MKTVTLGRKDYQVAECWNELTTKQMLRIAPILFMEIGIKERLQLFRILFGLSWHRWRLLNSSELLDKLYLTNFLLQKVNLSRMPMKMYRGLFGPGDSFCNLRGKEAAFTDAYFNGVDIAEGLSAESMKNLDMLVACLFRPTVKNYNHRLNPDGDCRVPFNPNVVPYFSRKIRRWPLNRKLIVYLWYAGCTNELVEQNPKVFTSGGEVALYGMWSTMRSIAKEAAHGDFSKVEAMYFPEIIMEINASITEFEQAQKK